MGGLLQQRDAGRELYLEQHCATRGGSHPTRIGPFGKIKQPGGDEKKRRPDGHAVSLRKWRIMTSRFCGANEQVSEFVLRPFHTGSPVEGLRSNPSPKDTPQNPHADPFWATLTSRRRSPGSNGMIPAYPCATKGIQPLSQLALDPGLTWCLQATFSIYHITPKKSAATPWGLVTLL